eukprot:TRINITY_DN10709_c0_g1_i17.p2 TRINITY_DN10709_c0_g1~~TRINITY_DN10709_c0_g1_i17.p2  ORF type:complete len:143 (+),score=31.58 TRINITY_DN10709_c0_g1_i17:258-686(+)
MQWDTAGQERFRTITSAYYKNADAVIVVYDCTSKSTFDNIESYWMSEINMYADKDVTLVLLGNKSDIETRAVKAEEAAAYAGSKNMMFSEVSAKTADGVVNIFNVVTERLMDKKPQPMAQKPKSLRNITDDDEEKGKSKCCK